jgi:hypothetical protein
MSEKWLHREVVDLHGSNGRFYWLRLRICKALIGAATRLCGFRRSGWGTDHSNEFRTAK